MVSISEPGLLIDRCIIRLMIPNEHRWPPLQVLLALYDELHAGRKLHGPFEGSSSGVLAEASVADIAEDKRGESAIDRADGEAGKGEDGASNEAGDGHVLRESQ